MPMAGFMVEYSQYALDIVRFKALKWSEEISKMQFQQFIIIWINFNHLSL